MKSFSTLNPYAPIKTKSFGRSKKDRNDQPFFQPKLTIGPVDGVYEREADAVADQVMRMPQSEVGIHRKCAECKEEALQMKPLTQQITPLIQTKSKASAQVATDSVNSGIRLAKSEGNAATDHAISG